MSQFIPRSLFRLSSLCLGITAALVVASVPLAARAELPPSVYDDLKKNAPESLEITVLETKLNTTKTEEWERTSVFATARVDSVVRSESGLKKGQVIKIRTLTEKAVKPGWVGPAPIPIIKKGEKYQAWLKRGGTVYYAAAKGQSFVSPPKALKTAKNEETAEDCDCMP